MSSSSDSPYKIGDLVWAKMRGHPAWPGKVSIPPINKKTKKENCHWIFFFGSENYAWIEICYLLPYLEHKDKFFNQIKTSLYKRSCKDIELYIKKNEVYNRLIKANTSNGKSVSVSNAKKKEVKLVPNVETNQKTLLKNKKTDKYQETATPYKTSESVKRKSTINNSTKVEPKKHKLSKISTDILTKKDHSSQQKNNTLLDKPEVTLPENVETVPLDNIGEARNTIIGKILASKLNFGFIGLGKIGGGIVMNLLNSGHKVNIWNRTQDKINKFIEAGAFNQLSPFDVVANSDITFCCVIDSSVAKEIVYGLNGIRGVLEAVSKNKAYVQMCVDSDTSYEISKYILKKGGRYMETMIQGSKSEAEQGNLLCLSAGDKSIYDQCQSIFGAISRCIYFIGEEIGTACKYNMFLHTLQAVSITALAEMLAATDKSGLCQKKIMDILSNTKSNSPLFMEEGNAMIEKHSTTNHTQLYLQKDVSMTVKLLGVQSCPVSAAVKKVFKSSK